MTTTCSQCGAALTERDTFCTNCGAKQAPPRSAVSESDFCTKCGGALEPGLALCTKCGAKRTQPVPPAPGLRFCPFCGTALDPDMRFCSKCGKAIVTAAAPAAPGPSSAIPAEPPPPAPAAPAPIPPAAPVAVPAMETPAVSSAPATVSPASVPPAAPSKSSPLLKIAAVVLGILALFTVAGIGTCVYIGYRVKHKVTEYAKEIKEATGQPASGGASKVETRTYADCEYKDRTGFDEYVKAAGSASIPFKPGLTLTNIWPDPKLANKDVEILITVAGVHSSTIEVTGMRLDGRSQQSGRTLCIADMLNAREYETGWGGDTPNTIPGATMFSLSKEEFEDLKAGRPAAFAYYDAHTVQGRRYTLSGFSKGMLSRVESDDVPYSAIVNGDQKDLPTIHAKGDLGGNPFEAWVLDEPANPLVLKFLNTKSNWHITYVKITFPVEKKIEQELAQNGRAEIYGIYFDFNSAKLRPESAPVLKEISDALKNNPSWKIMIDGHTDNVGGNDYNLRLSQRRSEAVKQALISEYGISADRMTPEGFGASRPKATNDTIEGRALNRRVELVRQ